MVFLQKDAVDQRILTIVFGCAIFMFAVILKYLKNFAIIIRANGLVSWKGSVSTFIGILFFGYFIGRCFTCYSHQEGPWEKRFYCAQSKDPSFRVMNDTLINFGILAFSTFIFYIARKILILKCGNCCTDCNHASETTMQSVRGFFSRDNASRFKYNVKNFFWTIPPPPYSPDCQFTEQDLSTVLVTNNDYSHFHNRPCSSSNTK